MLKKSNSIILRDERGPHQHMCGPRVSDPCSNASYIVFMLERKEKVN